ncbi:glycosyltransferase [Pseudomonadales bacterium]|nr:glycosyltransferase [Pseudomonadales bacterium]
MKQLTKTAFKRLINYQAQLFDGGLTAVDGRERGIKASALEPESNQTTESKLVRPLKILQVYRAYHPDTEGGVVQVIRQLAIGLNNLGHTVRVFVPSQTGPKIYDLDGVNVVTSKLDFEVASCSFTFSGIAEFQRQLEWADLVHYHFPWPFADMLHFLSDVSIPSLVTYHSDIVRQKYLLPFYDPLMKRFLNRVDCIVATSTQYANSSKFLNGPTIKPRTIPIGIDEDTYPQKYDDALDDVRQSFGEDFFLFVGVLRYYKGLDVMLDAAISGNFKVVIAGSGPELTRLNQKYDFKKSPQVHFAGHVPEETKMALYKLCKAVVLPSFSRAEAFGVTLLEGAMMSKPLISANPESGSSYVNVDGLTGLVAAPNDVQSLKQAMQRLQDNPDWARQLGDNARARYEEKFTGSKMVASYAAVYNEFAREERCSRELL